MMRTPQARTGVRQRRVRESALLLIVGAVVLALATAFAITSLRGHADGRRQAQVELAVLASVIEAHAGTVWAGIAGGDADGARLAQLQGRIEGRLDALTVLDVGGAELTSLIRHYAGYEVAAAQVIAASAAPSPSEREALSAASTQLSTALDAADDAYGRAALATAGAADVGTVTSLVSSAVLLALFFRRSERARRIAAQLEHERRVVRDSEARFGALVRHSSDMTTVIDAAGIVRYHSPSVARNLGISMVDLLDRPWRSFLHPDDSAAMDRVLDAAHERSRVQTINWRVRRADGSWLELETIASSLLHEPNIGGIVLNSRDVTDRRDLERRLYHQAFHDSLTGLPNRAGFMEATQRALADDPAGTAVLLLDLDGLKRVNDRLGHAAGDELLIAVGERMRSALREGDLAARLAGDEFAVLTCHLTDPSAATMVAERVAEAVEQPFTIGGRTLHTTASIGVAWATGATSTPDELLREADVAMYRAKADPARRVVSFEPGMHVSAPGDEPIPALRNRSVDVSA
jgi:diguanylate cyclase (GGDEF)-like protein/PAS domain S-box-containing protein